MKKKTIRNEDLGGYVWTYYPPHKCGYLKLADGKVDNTLALVDGRVLIDRDNKGQILGVEIIL